MFSQQDHRETAKMSRFSIYFNFYQLRGHFSIETFSQKVPGVSLCPWDRISLRSSRICTSAAWSLWGRISSSSDTYRNSQGRIFVLFSSAGEPGGRLEIFITCLKQLEGSYSAIHLKGLKLFLLQPQKLNTFAQHAPSTFY